jgi:hypothetical protein
MLSPSTLTSRLPTRLISAFDHLAMVVVVAVCIVAVVAGIVLAPLAALIGAFIDRFSWSDASQSPPVQR